MNWTGDQAMEKQIEILKHGFAKLCIRTEKFRFKTTDDMFHVTRFPAVVLYFLYPKVFQCGLLFFFNLYHPLSFVYFICYGKQLLYTSVFRKKVFKITEAHQK